MLFDKCGARSGSSQLITKTVQQCGQAYSKINDIHTYGTCLSVSVVEHVSKMSIEHVLSTGYDVSLENNKERGAKRKLCNLPLMHILLLP